MYGVTEAWKGQIEIRYWFLAGKYASFIMHFQNISINPIISEIKFLWRRHFSTLYPSIFAGLMEAFCRYIVVGLSFWQTIGPIVVLAMKKQKSSY